MSRWDKRVGNLGWGQNLGVPSLDGLQLVCIFPYHLCVAGNIGLPPVAPAALPPPPQGAFWGLMAGLVVGALRLVLEFLNPALPCGNPDTRPAILSSIHYLHFAVALFVFSGAVVVAGSLLTPPPQCAQVSLP